MLPTPPRRRLRLVIAGLAAGVLASGSLAPRGRAADAAGKSAAVPTTGQIASAKEEGIDWWNATGAIAGLVSAICAAIAAGQARQAARDSEKAASESQRSAQALALTQLWSDMTALEYFSEADLQKLDDLQFAERVRAVVNRLGKIAFYWSEHMIDRDALERQLSDAPVLIYQQIKGIGRLTALDRTGAELLAENKGIEPLIVALQLRFRKKR